MMCRKQLLVAGCWGNPSRKSGAGLLALLTCSSLALELELDGAQ